MCCIISVYITFYHVKGHRVQTVQVVYMAQENMMTTGQHFTVIGSIVYFASFTKQRKPGIAPIMETTYSLRLVAGMEKSWITL